MNARRLAAVCVLAASTAIAGSGARDYAGGWNDGSRLAAVESVVDRHTFVIDESVFVRPSNVSTPASATPYPPHAAALMRHGTLDKLLIDGRFYSDKPPVPTLLLGGVYLVMQRATGLNARDQPDRFCYWMTVASSGVAYVASAWCIFRLAGALQLSLAWCLALTASFGLSTVALVYTRHVNGHIQLLAVASALMLGIVRLHGVAAVRAFAWCGTLAGLGYAIDPGAGAMLLVTTAALVSHDCYRARTSGAAAAFLTAAVPWVALHHVLNYSLGGTWAPANTVAEYLGWPGSPHTAGNATGFWTHTSFAHFLVYSAELLVGKRGFLGHNLPLFLAASQFAMLARKHGGQHAAKVRYAGGVFLATWLLYAALSINYSGVAVSIRWFVPLLAPGYLVLAVLLREHPAYGPDFLALSAWGSALGWLMWSAGPWTPRMIPLFWPVQVGALATWGVCAWQRRRV